MRFRKLDWVACVLSVLCLLSGCSGGGGDGGGSGSTTPTPPPAVTTLSGTAAAGAPIQGTVNLRDSAGTTRTQTINSIGEFQFDLTGLTAPYLLWADGIANAKEAFFYSMATEGGRVNVTPATHCIMAMALGKEPVSYYRENPSAAPPDAAKVAAAKQQLATLFSKLFQTGGVPAGFDLMTGQFNADSTGFDGIMDVVEMNADEEFVNILDRGSNTALFKQELASGSVLTQETPEKVNELCMASTDVLKAVKDILKTLSDQFATTRPTYDQLLAVMQPLMSDEFRDNGLDREQKLAASVNSTTNPVGFTFKDIALYRKMKSHTFGNIAPLTINELPAGYAEGVWCTYTADLKNGISYEVAAFVKETADGPWKWHGDQNPFQSGGVVEADSQWWRNSSQLRIYSGLRFLSEDRNRSAFNRYGIDRFMVLNSALPEWTNAATGDTYNSIVLQKDADPSLRYEITSRTKFWRARHFERDGLDINAITNKEFVFVGFDNSSTPRHVWIDLLSKKPVQAAVLWKDVQERGATGEFSSYFSEILSIWGEPWEVYLPQTSLDSVSVQLDWEIPLMSDYIGYVEVGLKDGTNISNLKSASNPGFSDGSSLSNWLSTTLDISSLGVGPPVSGWSYILARDEFQRIYASETDFSVVPALSDQTLAITGQSIQYRTYSDPSKNGFRGFIDVLDWGLPIDEGEIQELRLLKADGTPVPLGETGFAKDIYYFNNSSTTPNNPIWEVTYYSEPTVKFPAGSTLTPGLYYYEAVAFDGSVYRSADIDFVGQMDMPFVDAASMKSEWQANGDLKLSWLLPGIGTFTQLRVWIFCDDAREKTLLGLNAPLTAQEVIIPKRIIESAKMLAPVVSPNWEIQLRYSAPGNSNQSARGYSDQVPIDGLK